MFEGKSLSLSSRRHNTQHDDTQYKDNQRNDSQRNNTQHNDILYKGIICNIRHNNTQHNDIHDIIMLNAIMLSAGKQSVILQYVVMLSAYSQA
jgi:hypothetical protein